MADSKSILPEPKKESNTYPSGLRKYVQASTQKINIPLTLPRLDILFGVSNKYSEEEKKKWWEEHKEKDKQFKVGLIKTKELDTRISIFGEVFDFSKTATKEKPLTNSEQANVKKAGFNVSENVIEEEVRSPPETYYTSKDFDKLYLGWLKPEDKTQRISLKQLFRFIFGNRKIKDVNKFHTKLLAAYTKFESKEKVPCGPLRSDFEESLNYRRELVIKEIEAADQVVGENNLYMEGKRAVLQGLRDILNRMYNREEKTKCFVYGNDETMKEDIDDKDLSIQSRLATMSDDDMSRLVRIFQNYITTMDKFKGKNVQTQGKELYEELRKLLELSNKAGSSLDTQKDLDDMTKLVEHLSFLLNAYSELHSIHIELKDVQIQLEKRKYEDLLEKNKGLEKRLDEFVTGIQEGNTDISRLLYRFSQSLLKKSQKNSETIQQEILTRFEQKDTELIQSRQQLKRYEEELQTLQQRIRETENELQIILTGLQTLIGPELERRQQEIQRLRDELQQFDLEQTQLQQQIANLREQERLFEGKEMEYQEELQQRNDEIDDNEERIAELKQQIEDLRTRLTQCEEERQRLLTSIQEQRTVSEGVAGELGDIRAQRQRELEEVQERLQEKDAEIARIRQDLEQVKQELTAEQTRGQEKDTQIQTLQEKIQQLTREKEESEETLRKLQSEKATDQQAIQEFQQRLTDINEELRQARQQLEGIVAELGEVREGQSQQHQSQEESLKAYRQSYSESADREEELKVQRNRLQQILDERTKQIREYEKEKQIQGGGSLSKEATCETMLTLLLFHIKEANMDVQDFLDKAGASLDDLGQCPIVLHVLNEMLDEADEIESKEDSIVYSPIRSEKSNDVMESIEKSIQGRFSEEEQNILASLNKPISFYSQPPELYRDSMGMSAYMLNNNVKEDMNETPFHGLMYDEITLTNEEREEIEKGGISLGAITFLYLTCLRDIQSRQGLVFDRGQNPRQETPTSSSKCLLPKRSLERAKTPKQSHKRSKASTLRSKQSTQPTLH